MSTPSQPGGLPPQAPLESGLPVPDVAGGTTPAPEGSSSDGPTMSANEFFYSVPTTEEGLAARRAAAGRLMADANAFADLPELMQNNIRLIGGNPRTPVDLRTGRAIPQPEQTETLPAEDDDALASEADGDGWIAKGTMTETDAEVDPGLDDEAKARYLAYFKRLVDEFEGDSGPELLLEVLESGRRAIHDKDDEAALMAAARLMTGTGLGSVSLIQRSLGTGFVKAGKLADELEEMRILGSSDGAKAREVLAKSTDIPRLFEASGHHVEDASGI